VDRQDSTEPAFGCLEIGGAGLRLLRPTDAMGIAEILNRATAEILGG